MVQILMVFFFSNFSFGKLGTMYIHTQWIMKISPRSLRITSQSTMQNQFHCERQMYTTSSWRIPRKFLDINQAIPRCALGFDLLQCELFVLLPNPTWFPFHSFSVEKEGLFSNEMTVIAQVGVSWLLSKSLFQVMTSLMSKSP